MAKITLGRRYEAKTLAITVLDAADAPVTLTGKTLRFVIARSPADAEAGTYILTKATGGSGITVTGASNNVATITIATGDYDDLPAGYYYGELRSMTDNLVYWPRSGEDEGDIEVLAGSPVS